MTQGRCSRNTILKRVIYTLYFAFYNVFLRPTRDRRCTMLCRGRGPSTPYPTSQQCANIGIPAAVPWHHIKHPATSICQSSTESLWDTVWRRYPLLQEDYGQNDRTTTQPSFSGIAKDTNSFLRTQSVWQTIHLQPCPGAARAGLLQDKGCVRSWVWSLCPPWCIPQHLNILGRTCCWSQCPSTVPSVAKRPGPESDI